MPLRFLKVFINIILNAKIKCKLHLYILFILFDKHIDRYLKLYVDKKLSMLIECWC